MKNYDISIQEAIGVCGKVNPLTTGCRNPVSYAGSFLHIKKERNKFPIGGIPWNKGKTGYKTKPTSDETKLKISIANKGKIRSEEFKQKIKDYFKKNGHPFQGRHHSTESIEKMRLSKLGKKASLETRLKMSKIHKGNKVNLGRKASEETRKKLSIIHSNQPRGDKAYNWKGGRVAKNQLLRNSTKMITWRISVFNRDNYTCQKYGIKNCYLQAHHINNLADFPELSYSIDNGITLSLAAHMEFHKKYGHKNNTKEQLEDFIGRKI